MKLNDLLEVKVHRNDPAMDDVYDERQRQEQDMKDAPYYVYWTGQSFEWYGDKGPETDEGRYKPKGDGGRIVAINVPTYEQARKIADNLDDRYQNHKFPDKSVYAEMGKDWYVVDYHGAEVGSMNDMNEWDRERLRFDNPTNFSATANRG